MTQVASNFSNALFHDQPVAGPSTYHLIDASTPSASTLVYSSSADRLVEPLGPAKTIRELPDSSRTTANHPASSSRRGVNFSQRNDTKFFHAQDILLPKDAPPPSIRSYLDSDPISSPFDSPSLGRSRSSSGTPSLVRSILKAKHLPIRIAASAEEGTLQNKEPARLVVSGKRPGLVARDSFQLAMIRKAASDKPVLPVQDDVPGSDDSTSSEGATERELSDQASADDSEEEEAVEEDGALGTGSLIDIILDGAEDLLTLEEAYTTLCTRLRISTRPPSLASPAAPSRVDSVRISIQPLKDKSTAIINALQRDLGRLMGKMPNEERASSDFESSPFRGLMPLQDATPINHATATPSPSPPASKKSPDAPRQGYSEAEVRYRREAAGVGVAALRFIAFVFGYPEVSRCFTHADLAAVLETVLIIPRTPILPTPNPKRTYHTAILVLTQMKIPEASVLPMKERVARALESALLDQLGSAARLAPAGGKEGVSSPTKKEAFIGVAHLVSRYPAFFLPHFAELLPACLKSMISKNPLHRSKASAAVAAFANSKVSSLATALEAAHQNATPQSRDAWTKAKNVNQKLESFVAAYLKSPLRIPGKVSPVYGQNGEKKIEASAIEQIFKDTIGNNPDVAWACAAWSSLVTLLGSSYSSSTLSTGFDFIMERSIQPSNNVIRPPVACTAWLHSAHSHLSAGSAVSIAEDGAIVQSWKPFAATAHLDVEARTRHILTPIHLALEMANAEGSAKREYQEMTESAPAQFMWERTEKTKKRQWMITCGLSAASFVYAYSGLALHHRDQPAKEMSAMTGMPSSDGAVIPDADPNEAVLSRLDRIWENVVSPILNGYLGVKGLDRLKTHAWSILFSLTSSRTTEEWSLDRLLCSRYLSGEAFTIDTKDQGLSNFVVDIEASAVKPSEIPTWGPVWISHRIEILLDTWHVALEGVPGLNVALGGNMYPRGKTTTIPTILSKIWLNLLRALANAHSSEAISADVFSRGVQAIAAKIAELLNMDPRRYLPIEVYSRDDVCTEDLDSTRITLVTFLVESAIEILGREAFASLRLDSSDMDEEPEGMKDLQDVAFGSDNEGRPAMAGMVLGYLLRTEALSLPLLPAARAAFRDLVQRVLKCGLANGNPTKLLGDLTNTMPFLFTTCEEVQLDVWRLLAVHWTEIIDVQPSNTNANGTNHTGLLLLSLLSGPFRGREVTSVWHQQATQDDLRIWQDLLRVTVLRFRAKRVGSNLGVLETLAGHLGDFLEPEAKTSSTTITLSCLAAAISWITFVPAEHYHAAHFISENAVPIDFLALVAQSLDDSYPAQDSESLQESATALSPATNDVLQALNLVFETLPAEHVQDCLVPLQASVALWMDDSARVADATLGQVLDELYITLLSALTRAIQAKHITPNAETLDTYFDLFAPRLSRALTSAVPKAFQTFWKTTFEALQNLDFSVEVRDFLRDVISAVPGIIEVSGLEVEHSMSEEESIARFPNAQSLMSQVAGLPSTAVSEADMGTEDVAVAQALPEEQDEPMPVASNEVSTEYDADVSASVMETQVNMIMVAPTANEQPEAPLEPMRALVSIKEESPARKSAEPSVSDVFGPGGVVLAKGRGKGRIPKRTPSAPTVAAAVAPARALGRSQSAPEPVEDEEDEIIYVPTPNDRTNDRTNEIPFGPVQNRSILSSAGRWLSKLPSFLSPANHTVQAEELVAPSSSIADEHDQSVDDVLASQTRSHRKPSYGEKRAAEPESDDEGQSPSKRQRVKSSRSSSHASSRSSSTSSRKAVQKGKQKMIRHSSSDSSTSSLLRETKRSAAEDGEEEEDELLLSPETARKQRRAEEAEISEQMLKAERSIENSPAAKRAKRIIEKQASQGSSGRFEDAPESPTHLPPATHPTEAADARQQLRVLAMVEQAARAKSAIESMDLNTLSRLMRSMNELRDAATSALIDRAKSDGR